MTADQISVLKKIRLTDAEIDAVHNIAVDAVDESPFGYVLAHAVLNAYKYGVMQGKRAERARRKGKAAIGAGTPIAATDTKISSPCVMCEYTTPTHRKERGIECSTI